MTQSKWDVGNIVAHGSNSVFVLHFTKGTESQPRVSELFGREWSGEKEWECIVRSVQNPYAHLAESAGGVNCVSFMFVVNVQSLSCIPLSATTWTAALQHSLFFTISWGLLRLMSIELMMPCHLAISSSITPVYSCSHSVPASGSFLISQLLASGGQDMISYIYTCNYLKNI